MGGARYNGPGARGRGHAIEVGSGCGETESEEALEEHPADLAANGLGRVMFRGSGKPILHCIVSYVFISHMKAPAFIGSCG